MIETICSRSGLPTAIVNGILLHSRFDPREEAIRFIRASLDPDRVRNTIILLGESFGYLTDEIRLLFPRAKLLTVYYSSGFNPKKNIPDPLSWDPENEIPFEQYLSENVSESDCSGIAVIEWPAAASSNPDLSKLINSALARHLSQLQGNVLTTAAMGRLWIRNAIFNAINISSIADSLPIDRGRIPFVAGSGPSLDRAIETILPFRNDLTVIALPSALEILGQHGIVPDVVVVTDPGYYSWLHLSRLKNARAVVAMPLSACRGIWKLENASVCFIEQPYFFEKELLSAIGARSIPIVPGGTVASSALSLALASSNGPIAVAGLDFCYDDILSHSRPNVFYDIMEICSNKLSPNYSKAFSRAMLFTQIKVNSRNLRTSRPLLSYSAWLSDLAKDSHRRIVQIAPIEGGFNRLPSIDKEEISSLITRFPGKRESVRGGKCKTYPLRQERMTRVKKLLVSWNTELQEFCNAIHARKSESIHASSRLSDLLYFYKTVEYLDVMKQNNISGNGIHKLLEIANFVRDDVRSMIDRLTIHREIG
jgi:hypothetical protein